MRVIYYYSNLIFLDKDKNSAVQIGRSRQWIAYVIDTQLGNTGLGVGTYSLIQVINAILLD